VLNSLELHAQFCVIISMGKSALLIEKKLVKQQVFARSHQVPRNVACAKIRGLQPITQNAARYKRFQNIREGRAALVLVKAKQDIQLKDGRQMVLTDMMEIAMIGLKELPCVETGSTTYGFTMQDGARRRKQQRTHAMII